MLLFKYFFLLSFHEIVKKVEAKTHEPMSKYKDFWQHCFHYPEKQTEYLLLFHDQTETSTIKIDNDIDQDYNK